MNIQSISNSPSPSFGIQYTNLGRRAINSMSPEVRQGIEGLEKDFSGNKYADLFVDNVFKGNNFFVTAPFLDSPLLFVGAQASEKNPNILALQVKRPVYDAHGRFLKTSVLNIPFYNNQDVQDIISAFQNGGSMSDWDNLNSAATIVRALERKCATEAYAAQKQYKYQSGEPVSDILGNTIIDTLHASVQSIRAQLEDIGKNLEELKNA